MNTTMRTLLAAAVTAAMLGTAARGEGPAPAATMPANHPPMAGGLHAGGGGTIKRPESGALRVLVTQGTKGAAAIGGEPATVELLAKGKVLKTYPTKLSDKGVLELTKLPIDVPFQPVVTIKHAGSEQQLVGPSINIYQPAVEMEMKVFEVTEEKPSWTIGMRIVQVTLDQVGDTPGLRILETIGAYNPTDKAWLGEKQADGSRRTLSLKLPAGAMDVGFGPGLLEAGAKVENNVVTRGKTLLPESTEYVLGYFVPAIDGRTMMRLTMPADTTLMAVYMPVGIKIDKATGLEPGKADGSHGSAKNQLLLAKSVKAGTDTVVVLSGITPEAVAEAKKAAAEAAAAATKPAATSMPMVTSMPGTRPAK